MFLVRISELFFILIRRLTFLKNLLSIQLASGPAIHPTFRIMHQTHISSIVQVIRIISSPIPTPQPLVIPLRVTFPVRNFLNKVIISNIRCLILCIDRILIVSISRSLIIF
jgi:hypothetical protein